MDSSTRAYLILAAIYSTSCIYLTLMVLADPTLSRNRRAWRLFLIWLVPIIGMNLVNMRYGKGLPSRKE